MSTIGSFMRVGMSGATLVLLHDEVAAQPHAIHPHRTLAGQSDQPLSAFVLRGARCAWLQVRRRACYQRRRAGDARVAARRSAFTLAQSTRGGCRVTASGAASADHRPRAVSAARETSRHAGLVGPAHNLVPHEGHPLVNYLGYRLVASQADLVIAHSDSAARAVQRRYRARCVVVMRIGNFVGYPPPRPRGIVLAELGTDPGLPTVACVGAVQMQEGLPQPRSMRSPGSRAACSSSSPADPSLNAGGQSL